MTPIRFGLAAPIALALVLGACGKRSASEAAAGSYCPNPFTVQDTDSLTRFKPGPGRDPRDVAFQAALTGTGVTCEVGKGKLEVDLKMRITVDAGPSVATGVASVPYFVRVIGGGGSVVQGQDFNATFRLSTASPRGASIEEITLTLFFTKPSDLGAYRVAIGLKPTPEELDYNRRSTQR